MNASTPYTIRRVNRWSVLPGAAGNEVGASPQPVIGTTLLLGNRLCDFLL